MPLVDAPPTFRLLLANELARRCLRNPRYSLRAFARALGTDHASLSQIIRGRRRALTRNTVRRLGRALRLDAHTIERYCDGTVIDLLARDTFRPDSRWIALAQQASIDEVNISLQRLLCEGALHMASTTDWHAHPRTSSQSVP